MQSLLRRLAPSPNSEARTNFWLACIPLGVFILARAAIELDALLAAGRVELDQLDKAIAGRRDALAGAYSGSLHAAPDTAPPTPDADDLLGPRCEDPDCIKDNGGPHRHFDPEAGIIAREAGGA